MKRINYDDLAGMTTSEIVEITSSQTDFIVFVNAKTGKHLYRFIENDKAFRRSNRKFLDRVGFFFRGWHGFLVLEFVQIWNRAHLDGYEVKKIDRRESSYDVLFSRH